MHLHEYQAKKLLHEYGIPVPPGEPAFSVREALRCAAELGEGGWIVKAQVHSGGRGKAGGVQRARDWQELERQVRGLLGTRLMTRQSAPEGKPVHCVLVQAAVGIERELYLAMLVNRSDCRVAIVASAAGGMDIEEIAEREPDKIHRLAIDPVFGLGAYQCRQLGFLLGLDAGQRRQLTAVLRDMYRLFADKDLSLLEINPLAIDERGELLALDAKISIDDNALFRQGVLAEWRDPTQTDEKESMAKRFDLNYVALDGNIGCMVNGAGLAMATMDIIQLHGGRPANFLDVGGGATTERVSEAFKIIVSDPQVQAILVNIFGGIVRCDLIAEGVIQAVREVGVRVPVVARLEGTQVRKGRQLLTDSGLAITPAEDLADAAVRAVAAAGEGTDADPGR